MALGFGLGVKITRGFKGIPNPNNIDLVTIIWPYEVVAMVSLVTQAGVQRSQVSLGVSKPHTKTVGVTTPHVSFGTPML